MKNYMFKAWLVLPRHKVSITAHRELGARSELLTRQPLRRVCPLAVVGGGGSVNYGAQAGVGWEVGSVSVATNAQRQLKAGTQTVRQIDSKTDSKTDRQ